MIFFAEKFWETFRLIFKKFQPKFSDLGQKTAGFTRFWEKKLNKLSAKKENLGQLRP